MYVKSLRAQNYRCFKDQTVEFQKGLNVIIGENNAGKTALLRALGLVFQREGRRPMTRHDFHHGPINDYDTPPFISVLVTLASSETDTDADRALVATWLTKLEEGWEARLTYRFFLPEGDFEEFRERYKAGVGDAPARYWGAVEQLLPKFVSRVYGGDEEAKNRAEPDALATFDFQFLDAIRDAEAQMLSGRSPLLKRMLERVLDHAEEHREKTARSTNEKRFKDAALALVDLVKRRLDTKTLFRLIDHTGAKAAGGLDVGGSITERDLLLALSLLVSKLGIQLPISHNGLGYNNLIYVSLVLASLAFKGREYEGDNEKLFPMLVVEEPEAHLHPALQYQLLKYVRERLENATVQHEGSRQVFMTTHSTHVTAAAGLDALICMVADEEGGIRVAYPGRVFGESKEGRHAKRYVERYLDATKSNMLFSKGVILVEGMAELQLVPCFAAYLNRPLEDYFATVIAVDGLCFKHFLPLFGAGMDPSLRSYAINRRVACVIDADPMRKQRTAGTWTKCWPYEVGQDDASYEYRPVSSAAKNLRRQVDGVGNVSVLHGEKTLEYDLALANAGSPIIVTSFCTYDTELRALATDPGADDAKLRERAGDGADEALKRLAGVDADQAWRARLATYYLASAEGAKGEHAFELERVLRENLARSAADRASFNVPAYIAEAIRWVCTTGARHE